MSEKTALVIGATGGVGGAVASALLQRGWRVNGLNRNPDKAASSAAALKGINWVKGDAMDAASVRRAAEGADLIVHGANPPGYRNWAGLVLPMLESSIAAARAVGARLMLPGTVYNYGPDAGAAVDENAPQNPETRKGKIRVEMERRLKQSGVKTLILRVGDFFGPHAGNNWFAQGLVTPGKPIAKVTYPGPHSIGHSWGYLPDVGETAARLIEREADLGPFEVFHFEGQWLEPGVTMADAIRRVAGKPDLKISSLPWFALYLIAPFNETFREMLEMHYLWKRPLRLKNAKLVAFLGEEPRIPLDDAVRTTLASLGCLPEAAPQGASKTLSHSYGK